jgi:hypothetical protein
MSLSDGPWSPGHIYQEIVGYGKTKHRGEILKYFVFNCQSFKEDKNTKVVHSSWNKALFLISVVEEPIDMPKVVFTCFAFQPLFISLC